MVNTMVMLMILTIMQSMRVLALEPYDSSQATNWLGVEVIEPQRAGIGTTIVDVPFFELRGHSSSLYKIAGTKGTVIVVRDPECPVSKRYEYRKNKCHFYPSPAAAGHE